MFCAGRFRTQLRISTRTKTYIYSFCIVYLQILALNFKKLQYLVLRSYFYFKGCTE